MEVIRTALGKQLVPGLSVGGVLGLGVCTTAFKILFEEIHYSSNFGIDNKLLLARQFSAISAVAPAMIAGLFMEALKIQSVASFANRIPSIRIIQKVFAAVILVSIAAGISIQTIIWHKSRDIKLFVKEAFGKNEISTLQIALSTFSGLFKRKTTHIQLVINPKNQDLLITSKENTFFSSLKDGNELPSEALNFLYEDTADANVEKEIGNFLNMLAHNGIIETGTKCYSFSTDPNQIVVTDANYEFLEHVQQTPLTTFSHTLPIEGTDNQVQVLIVSNPKRQFSYIKSMGNSGYYGPFKTKYTVFFVIPKELDGNEEEKTQFIEKVKATIQQKAQVIGWDLDQHPLHLIELSDENAYFLNNPEAFSIEPKSVTPQSQVPEPLPITG